MRHYKHRKQLAFAGFLLAMLFTTGCQEVSKTAQQAETAWELQQEKLTEEAVKAPGIEDVPEYDGQPYVILNDNEPEFTKEEITDISYETYSELDELGRCGAAEASVGQDIMPTEERGAIGAVKPTGWQTVKYDFVDGKYLYNRCHLLGYQLTGENANEKNLITGTRYMNVDGMLPFENMVADYVHDTGNHVMYRVTPLFEGDDLVASGVQIEAKSVEDDGEGVCFNVYVYDVRPGVEIDYATGKSTEAESMQNAGAEKEAVYIVNRNTRKFHRPDCASVEDIREGNRKKYTGSRERLIEQGFEPCGRCKP